MMGKNRKPAILSALLSAAMVCSLLTVPVMAGGPKKKGRDVHFTVSAGDLLVVTNPVAWEQGENGWEDADKNEEPMGTADVPSGSESEPEEGAELDGFTENKLKGTAAIEGGHSGCDTIDRNERYKAWEKAHPGSLKAHLSDETEYKEGDTLWR